MEYVAPGLIRESSAGGLVTVLVVDSGCTTKTFEALNACVDQLFAQRTGHTPSLLLSDLRKANTPKLCHWFQRQIIEAVECQPDWVCYVALIVSQDCTGISLPNIRRCIVSSFLSRQQALTWLLNRLVDEAT